MKSDIPNSAPSLPSPALARLNSLPAPEATALLLTACGSHAWAESMAAARPFPTPAALLAASDRIWISLPHKDWLEAFSHHPRIGERLPGPSPVPLTAALGGQCRPPQAPDTSAQAAREQSGMASATEAQRADFIAGNHQYEQRFGHIFLICATGKSAAEMLNHLRRRLKSDPAAELATTAREQAMITRLRLENLCHHLAVPPQGGAENPRRTNLP